MRRLCVTVNKQVCGSNQMCLQHAGGVFQLDVSGKAEVMNPTGDSEADIVAAAYACPVGAITVIDEETGADLLD